MTEPKLQRPQFDSGSPTDSLVVTPQPTPDDTVQVSLANVLTEDDSTFLPFGGASSGSFGPLSVSEASRWDLLTLEVSGGTLVLTITPGTPAPTIQNFQDSLPPIPAATLTGEGHIPIAAIRVTEVTPAPVIIGESDIVDLRAFFHVFPKDSKILTYFATTPADWFGGTEPPNVAEALDELADRLNTDVTPTTVDPETNGTGNIPGVSLVAARADHQHEHGDLSGAAQTHHDAPQVEFVPTTPGDWTTNPTTVQEALDERGTLNNLADLSDVSADEAAAFNAMRASASVDNALATMGDVRVIEGIDFECATPAIGAREIRLNAGWRVMLADPADNDLDSWDAATKFRLFVGNALEDITPDVTADVIDEVSAGLVASTHYAIYICGVTSTGDVGIAVSRDRVTFGFTKPDLSNIVINGNTPDVFRLIGCATTDGSSDFLVTNTKMGYTHYLDDQIFRSGPPGGSWANFSAAAFIPPVSTRGVFFCVASSLGGSTFTTFSAIGGTTGSSGGQELGVIFSSSNANSQINNQFEEFLDSNQEMALRNTGAVLSATYIVNGYYIDLVGQL